MRFSLTRAVLPLAAGLCALAASGSAEAATCVGNCGTMGANGVVTAPPASSTYSYVSTDGGVSGAGQISGVGGTNGSSYTTDTFSAAAGDLLNFYFNYVTSDGSSQYSDYGFAQLLTGTGTSVGYLFTARTVPTGNTSPGFGLPANISTLNPTTTAINAGATTWAALGSDSGRCFSGTGNGCGSTGWIESNLTIKDAGTYKILFGTTNFSDNSFDSGLAFAGLTIGGTPVEDVAGAAPEPGAWAMMLLGFGVVGSALRRQRPRLKLKVA